VLYLYVSNMRKLLLLTPLVFILFSSCKILRPNLMLKTPKDYNYDKLSDSIMRLDYKVAINDAIQFRVFANDGMRLTDLANNVNITSNFVDVLVETDGTIKTPMVGLVPVVGLTLREVEKALEEKYTDIYVKPFVTARVINKRVIVFPGNGGSARVLNLNNSNTTVIEAIANASGITEDGKAYKVKLIRNNVASKPQVYLMDLSTIEGLAAGNTRVSSNDIIYVEPRYKPFRALATEVTPLITLLSTTIILYSLFRTK
jgi:polysaccharide export outer membrane protein